MHTDVYYGSENSPSDTSKDFYSYNLPVVTGDI